jgi:hypothetical protein
MAKTRNTSVLRRLTKRLGIDATTFGFRLVEYGFGLLLIWLTSLAISGDFFSAFLSMTIVAIGFAISFLIRNFLSSKPIRRVLWAMNWSLIVLALWQQSSSKLNVRDFFIFWIVFTCAFLVAQLRAPDVIDAEREI